MTKKNVVLFVDDEPLVLNSLRRESIKEEYKSLFSSSGEEALEVMEKENVNVIVTDMRMPKMNGLELLKIVKEKYPDVTRIVLSGYTQLPQIIATINKGDIFKFIPKPWKFDNEFKPAIDEAIRFNNMILNQKELLGEFTKKNQLVVKDLEDCKLKIKGFNNNIKKVKELNKKGFNLIKNIQCENNIGVEKIKDNILDIYQSYINSYLDLLPIVKSRFNISELIKVLKEHIEEKHENQVVIQSVGNIEVNISSNYMFILWSLKQVINILTEYSKDDKIILVVKAENKASYNQIHFVTKIATAGNQFNDGIEKVLLESQIRLLYEFMDSTCMLDYKLVNDDLYLEFNFNCSKE